VEWGFRDNLIKGNRKPAAGSGQMRAGYYRP